VVAHSPLTPAALLGRGTLEHNTGYHPFGAGEMCSKLAISKQWMTAVEVCGFKLITRPLYTCGYKTCGWQVTVSSIKHGPCMSNSVGGRSSQRGAITSTRIYKKLILKFI